MKKTVIIYGSTTGTCESLAGRIGEKLGVGVDVLSAAGLDGSVLEAADNLSALGPVLYVSGEESNSQIKLRADRLGVKGENLLLYTETSTEDAIERAKECKAQMLIVDSIQTMQSESADSAAGSVSQVRASTALFTRFAKDTGTVVMIVGFATTVLLLAYRLQLITLCEPP